MTGILENVQHKLFSNFTQLSRNDLDQIPDMWYTKKNVSLLQKSLINWMRTEQSVVNDKNVGKLFDFFYQYMYELSNELVVTGMPDSDDVFDHTFYFTPDMAVVSLYRSSKDAYREIMSNSNFRNRDDCLNQLKKYDDKQLLIEVVDFRKRFIKLRPLTVNDFMDYTNNYIKALKK